MQTRPTLMFCAVVVCFSFMILPAVVMAQLPAPGPVGPAGTAQPGAYQPRVYQPGVYNPSGGVVYGGRLATPAYRAPSIIYNRNQGLTSPNLSGVNNGLLQGQDFSASGLAARFSQPDSFVANERGNYINPQTLGNPQIYLSPLPAASSNQSPRTISSPTSNFGAYRNLVINTNQQLLFNRELPAREGLLTGQNTRVQSAYRNAIPFQDQSQTQYPTQGPSAPGQDRGQGGAFPLPEDTIGEPQSSSSSQTGMYQKPIPFYAQSHDPPAATPLASASGVRTGPLITRTGPGSYAPTAPNLSPSQITSERNAREIRSRNPYNPRSGVAYNAAPAQAPRTVQPGYPYTSGVVTPITPAQQAAINALPPGYRSAQDLRAFEAGLTPGQRATQNVYRNPATNLGYVPYVFWSRPADLSSQILGTGFYYGYRSPLYSYLFRYGRPPYPQEVGQTTPQSFQPRLPNDPVRRNRIARPVRVAPHTINNPSSSHYQPMQRLTADHGLQPVDPEQNQSPDPSQTQPAE